MNTIRRHARAVALVALAFLLSALVGWHVASGEAPVGKIERGPIAKPAAAALAAPLAAPQGKVEGGPVAKDR